MEYHSIQDILDICSGQKMPFWQVVVERDMTERSVTAKESFATMQQMYQAMADADKSYDGELHSVSGMVGGDGALLSRFNQKGNNLCGDFMGLVMEKAIKMGESNACMKRIVAAPTAGACGVIPAVLLSYNESFEPEEEELIKALFVSAGIGQVISENAYIAGASGGCQAEIGSAAAMAAGALAYLQKGDGQAIAHAAALSLKNMLGLTCDPVCGLVEVPCVKRNVFGAVNAVTAAQLAMAGIRSVISPDDVIDSMRRIGNAMPKCLKETSEGGLAVTKSAGEIMQRI